MSANTTLADLLDCEEDMSPEERKIRLTFKDDVSRMYRELVAMDTRRRARQTSHPRALSIDEYIAAESKVYERLEEGFAALD